MSQDFFAAISLGGGKIQPQACHVAPEHGDKLGLTYFDEKTECFKHNVEIWIKIFEYILQGVVVL